MDETEVYFVLLIGQYISVVFATCHMEKPERRPYCRHMCTMFVTSQLIWQMCSSLYSGINSFLPKSNSSKFDFFGISIPLV